MSETLTPASLGRITSEEISSQPECWSRAQDQAINPPAGLPAASERAQVLECGDVQRRSRRRLAARAGHLWDLGKARA